MWQWEDGYFLPPPFTAQFSPCNKTFCSVPNWTHLSFRISDNGCRWSTVAINYNGTVTVVLQIILKKQKYSRNWMWEHISHAVCTSNKKREKKKRLAVFALLGRAFEFTVGGGIWGKHIQWLVLMQINIYKVHLNLILFIYRMLLHFHIKTIINTLRQKSRNTTMRYYIYLKN